jgi:hypothetical protein
MERTIINFKEDYFYPGEHTSSAVSGILYLAGFLCIDVGSSVESWKEWINDPESIDVGSNYSHVEKQGNIITIAFDYDWFHETPGAPVFTLTLKQMNYILDRWKEALEKKPNKIVITKHDNDEITVDFEE